MEAFGEAMKPVDVNYSSEVLDEAILGTQDVSTNAIGRTVIEYVTALAASGALAYTYEHVMSWQYDGSEVVSISADAGPKETGLPWKYVEDSSSVIQNNSDHAVSYQEGEFAMCLYVPTCVVVDRRYPFIDLKADSDGSYNVISKDDDDGNNSGER